MSHPRSRTPVRTVVLAVTLVVIAFVAATAITRLTGRSSTPPTPRRPAVPAVLDAATAPPTPEPTPSAAPAPSPTGVAAALTGPTTSAALGARLLSRVVDVTTGQVLFDHSGAVPAAPASTAKLMTAAAILAVRRVTDRFATTVLDAGNGTIVLVGGGDPTLSAAAPGSPTLFPGAARISDLAAGIEAAHTTVTHLVVDDSLFVGPSVSPRWDASDIGTNYAAPITPVLADAAQTAGTGSLRSTSPDLAAGADLAAALGTPRLPVTLGIAPTGARRIARVESASLGQLLPEMLLASDNVIAEVLARQVAIAMHLPASFTAAAAAIRTVLARFGVDVGTGMVDGSGLAASDRVSPATLVALLRLIGGTGPARLDVLAGALPVARWSGTLQDRFAAAGDAVAAGRVRGKTGTLTGVSALAGLVRDRSGRLLAFAFDADRATSTVAAETGLDGVVSALAQCGCR